MKKYSKSDRESYTLGTTLTMELLIKKTEFAKRIYIHSKQEKNETYYKIVNICEKNNIDIIPNDKIINLLSEKENCYIIGVFEKFPEKIDYNQNHVVLVNPSNMGNLGTIIRSCLGFGINNIIIIKPGVDIFNPKVVRSSMGSIFSINYKYYDNFESYYQECSNRDYYPFMLKATNDLRNINVTRTYSLIFGNEAEGLDDSFLDIGVPLIIKHSKNIDSLNLDNAVSIALYEFTKKDLK